jgi:opacity protein-like surface antigen
MGALGRRWKLVYQGSATVMVATPPIPVDVRSGIDLPAGVSLSTIFGRYSAGKVDAIAGSAFELHRHGRTIVRGSVDSSDWSYQVQGGLEFQFTRNIWAQLGWCYLKYDYNQGGFTNKTALNDRFLQGGINV